MYSLFFRLVLQRVDPERAHALARRSLRALRCTAPGRALVSRLAGAADPCLETRALGLVFSSPVGVAAGVDKDATWFEDLAALGFGFVEVGTITALAQDGNPRPRLVRSVRDRALVNRMGFPNPGAEVAAGRLRRRTRSMRAIPDTSAAPGTGRTRQTIAGVNIGKSRLVPIEAAGQDYAASARLLGPVADYLVVNVSSPNTPGLRQIQEVELLRGLIADVRSALRAADCTPPLLIKIAPDLDDRQLDAVSALALELQLDGIVAVNTTVDRGGLTDADESALPFEGGGVSGAPLRARALEVLSRLRANVGDRLVLVSVGGVESASDVWERVAAGASLVQVYTAFVYGGPGWPGRINRELARRTRAAGLGSIQDLVGAGADRRAEREPQTDLSP